MGSKIAIGPVVLASSRDSCAESLSRGFGSEGLNERVSNSVYTSSSKTRNSNAFQVW